jgi:hypothetical protein
MLNIVGHWSQTGHKGARSGSSGTGLRGVHRKQMLKGGGHGNYKEKDDCKENHGQKS